MDLTDKKAFCDSKIKEWQGKREAFCKETGLHKDEAREWIGGGAHDNNGDNKRGVQNKSNLPSLVDNVDKILNGTKGEKEGLKQKYFKMADTPQELKEWLKGDKIIVRYGVIARHKNKDANHNFNPHEWKKICKKLNTPLAIEPYKDWYNVYINFKKNDKIVLVAMQTKSNSKNTFVNDVKTVFARDIKSNDKIIFLNKKRLETEISDREQSPNISVKPNTSISPSPQKSIVKSIDIW